MSIYEKNIDNKTIPDVLYHYTTYDGFLSIIRSGELWATNVQYMNDVSEFFHAIYIALDILKKYRFQGGFYLQRYIANAIQRLEGMKSVDVCAVSFCENGDLLSQWRGYSGASGGVCLGISSAALKICVERSTGQLAPCVYRADEQHRCLSETIAAAIGRFSQFDEPNEPTTDSQVALLVADLLVCAPLFKHIGFEEEAEWRLVVTVNAGSSDYDFRVGRSMLMPFKKIGLRADQWGGELQRVTVGPCPHPDHIVRSVNGLVGKFSGACSCEVTTSKTPYRNW
jgi:Protein of unknown function (DUF2971)